MDQALRFILFFILKTPIYAYYYIMSNIDNILRCFPLRLREFMQKNISSDELEVLEEIRIRNNKNVILNLGLKEKILNYVVMPEETEFIFEKICENSIYTYQNQIINGFITLNGGNRVGLVGTAVIKDGKIINFNYISSLNFRISRQILGCSNKVLPEIINAKENCIYNTLIVSEPGKGKTTLLRDIVRNLSNGIEGVFKGQEVCVVDERCEISATYKGISQNDLGLRTDVINDTPKAIGMRMAIRSMAPKIIVADEIGSKEDAEAIRFALCSGVKGIFTAHGKDVKDICKNPELNKLVEEGIFDRIIRIERRNNIVCEKNSI